MASMNAINDLGETVLRPRRAVVTVNLKSCKNHMDGSALFVIELDPPLLGHALVANLLCPGQERHVRHKSEV
jgi:hypothetical protein